MRISSIGYFFQTNEIEFKFSNGSLKTSISKFKQLKNLNHEELLKYKIKKNHVEWNDEKIYTQEILQLININSNNKAEVIHKIPLCKVSTISNDNKLFLDDFLMPLKPTITLPDLTIDILLKLNPPLVRKIRGGYECIVNTTEFRLAKRYLPEETIIPVRFISRSEIKKLDEYLLCDVFIKPLIYSLNKQKYSFLYKSWLKLLGENKEIINLINLPKQKSKFANLFGINARKLDEQKRKST